MFRSFALLADDAKELCYAATLVELPSHGVINAAIMIPCVTTQPYSFRCMLSSVKRSHAPAKQRSQHAASFSMSIQVL
jgi:hypothetical protein